MTDISGEDKIYRKGGWDYFTPDVKDVDTFEYQNCRVCNTPFTKTPDDGPTTIGEARVGRKHKHFAFTCQHSGTDWHNQALAIRVKAENTPSGEETARLEMEANQIVRLQKATKKVYVSLFSKW